MTTSDVWLFNFEDDGSFHGELKANYSEIP